MVLEVSYGLDGFAGEVFYRVEGGVDAVDFGIDGYVFGAGFEGG